MNDLRYADFVWFISEMDMFYSYKATWLRALTANCDHRVRARVAAVTAACHTVHRMTWRFKYFHPYRRYRFQHFASQLMRFLGRLYENVSAGTGEAPVWR